MCKGPCRTLASSAPPTITESAPLGAHACAVKSDRSAPTARFHSGSVMGSTWERPSSLLPRICMSAERMVTYPAASCSTRWTIRPGPEIPCVRILESQWSYVPDDGRSAARSTPRDGGRGCGTRCIPVGNEPHALMQSPRPTHSHSSKRPRRASIRRARWIRRRTSSSFRAATACHRVDAGVVRTKPSRT